MKIFFKIVGKINHYLGNFVSYLNIAVVGIVCWEITARYLFGAPTIWASEGMVMLSGGMYVLAGGYAQLHKRHVRIDLLYTHLGLKGKAICDIITYFFFSLFMYALVWHGGIYAWEAIRLGETTGTPWDPIIYPSKMAIPVGAALLWLQMTADLLQNVFSAFMGREV
jgi:TRAP-type mannitol/chloroaromatic compound transport system permease small subunit